MIGKHAELLVNRKSQGKPQRIGLGHRNIDMFAKHPENDYYQAIEVRNRSEAVKPSDLDEIVTKVEDASMKWEENANQTSA